MFSSGTTITPTDAAMFATVTAAVIHEHDVPTVNRAFLSHHDGVLMSSLITWHVRTQGCDCVSSSGRGGDEALQPSRHTL